jgi:hypothetical protein
VADAEWWWEVSERECRE